MCWLAGHGFVVSLRTHIHYRVTEDKNDTKEISFIFSDAVLMFLWMSKYLPKMIKSEEKFWEGKTFMNLTSQSPAAI
jgi:hypothetical protein